MSSILKTIKRYYDMIVHSITAFCYVEKGDSSELNEALLGNVLLSKCENETTNMIILGQTVAPEYTTCYHKFETQLSYT